MNRRAAPGRRAIVQLLLGCAAPIDAGQIAYRMGVRDATARRILDRRLDAMIRDGELIRNRRGHLGLVRKMDLLSGRVLAHPDGYGFFSPDEGDRDLFLPPRQMRGVLHGDRVIVRPSARDRRGRSHAVIVEVIERVNTVVVGRFQLRQGMAYVVPDNRRLCQDILIPPEARNGAQPGQFVVVQLTRQPDRHVHQPMGTISEVIGDILDVDTVTDIAIRTHELPFDWPLDVQDELAALSRRTHDGKKYCDREDLQGLDFVTIDGEDAQDFDDAVYCERWEGGWRLYVAIADVSHYVAPGSALDREAWRRATSVYFPRRVLPMLPEPLANDLCSLRPDTPRLAMVCIMDFDSEGRQRHAHFCRAMIRSRARLYYGQVASALVDRDAQCRAAHRSVMAALDELYALFLVLRRRRSSDQGLIEFSAVETRVVFDRQGGVQSLMPLVRNDAHCLIEECMLAANTAAAQQLHKARIPALYRIHPPPDQEKLQDVRDFLREFSLELGGGDTPQTKDYACLLAAAREREEAHLIETVLLRSMALAVYSDDNIGHFGLGFPLYTHFTSPIRRYPDLLVHRAIGHLLTGDPEAKFVHTATFMHEAGAHCSTLERRAEEATRDALQRMKCIYLKQHVGDEFHGRVSAVTAFGLFVELDRLFIEGLVHISTLPQDYYHHDPVAHRLQGERSGREFRLGDPVHVQVARVSVDDKHIDFICLSAGDKKNMRGAERASDAISDE